jgi:hypothetical protein
MKKYTLLMLALLALAAISMAQTASEPASAPAPAQAADAKAPAPPSDLLPSGSILSADLSKSLDAKKAKEGDKIEAKTATDMLAHGQIVVPRNTKIVGHVTQAKPHSKESPDSMVGITFDRMLLKDGREVPLQLIVQAVARPLQLVSSLPGTPGDAPSNGPANMPGPRTSTGNSSPGGSGGMGGGSAYPSVANPGAPGGGDDSAMTGGATSTPLSAASRGVVGIKGLSMDAPGPVAVLSSNTGNVHLEGGTQLILRVQ